MAGVSTEFLRSFSNGDSYKKEVTLLQTLSRFFHLVQFDEYSLVYEKERHCLTFTSSTKREIMHFHVVVVQRRQRNVQENVMHVQSCCFDNQRAKKVVSDSPGLVDFAIGLVNSVINLPDGQVMFFDEFE